MSASTRTVQRTLGINQLGSMLALLAVLAVVVAAIAFSSIGVKQVTIAPAAGFKAPVVLDRGSRDEIGPGLGAKTQAAESGKTYWQPDGRGGIELVPAKPATGAGGFGGFGGPRLGADDAATGQPHGTSPNRMHAR